MQNKYLFIFIAFILMIVYGCHKSAGTINPGLVTSVKKIDGGSIAYEDTTITDWFKRNSNSLGSIAFDQAFSIPLANGKVLWLTGDTYYADLNPDTTTPCLFNYHNTVLQQPSTSNWTQQATVNLKTSSGSPQIFNAENVNKTTNNYLWPLTGIEVNGKVYIYLYKNNGATSEPPLIGILNENDNTVDTTAMTAPALNGIVFDSGMFRVGNYVYIYGNKLMDGFGTTRVYLARCSTANRAIQFWDGANWVSTCPNPSVNTDGVVATILSNAVTVSYINGKYVMIATQFLYNCDGGTNIYGTASTSPTSGFGNLMNNVIYNIPDKELGADGKYHTPVFYTPVIHPEFTANNEFLFTYCINGYDNIYHSCTIPSCSSNKANPDNYRPRAVRVPFSVLGL